MDKELEKLLLLGGAELISIVVLVFFWRKRPAPGAKLLWSLVIIVPVLGPLFYLLFYSPPEPSKDRARENPDVYHGHH